MDVDTPLMRGKYTSEIMRIRNEGTWLRGVPVDDAADGTGCR